MLFQTLFAAALIAAVGSAHGQAVSNYRIDPAHSFVTFEADHLGLSTLRGRFDRSAGSIGVDRAAGTGEAEITIDLTSVSTGVAALDTRLKGTDFFDTAEHPSARFSAAKFSFDGAQVTEVTGSLTLLGKTLPVTLKASRFNCYANLLFRRQVCGGDFEATILRSQWGMTWGLDRGVPDRIRLLVQVEAVEQ